MRLTGFTLPANNIRIEITIAWMSARAHIFPSSSAGLSDLPPGSNPQHVSHPLAEEFLVGTTVVPVSPGIINYGDGQRGKVASKHRWHGREDSVGIEKPGQFQRICRSCRQKSVDQEARQVKRFF